jgi:DNA-binding HxlR family transcriptional regulator
LLSKTSRTTIGDVTVEIDQKIAKEASPELRQALSGISANGLKLLVDVGETKQITTERYSEFQSIQSILQELEKKGLAYVLKLEEDDIMGDYEYGLTELGLRAFQLIKQVLIDMLLSKES